jgi:hypothetical protein
MEFIGSDGNYDLLQLVKVKRILRRKISEPEVDIDKFIKRKSKNIESVESKLLQIQLES